MSRRLDSPLSPSRRPLSQARRRSVEELLVGEGLDTLKIPYAFDSHHVGLVAVGAEAEEVVAERAGAWDTPNLMMRSKGGELWGWVCRQEGFACEDLDALAAPVAEGDVRLAVGEPAQGIAGWRLTHQQARAALSVARRGADTVVRYADVALLASVFRDELLATSMRHLYLEPLNGGRGGGEELRCTLRAYFDAGRNVSDAGDAIGVTRQAVARRLRAAEERLGRPLAGCGPELEIALRLDALDPAPAL